MGRFFFSFFKELNSSSSKTMISLAFVLGLISGFLPLHNIFLWLILLFVFIFRIPLGLYFASYTVFALFSYILDPIFNKVGYFILTAGFLKPLWTFFYNLPLMRWSGFNNTLVMGSFVIGIIIGIPVFIYLNKSIEYYRKTVFPQLRNVKILSWIVPKEEKKGIFRLSGFIFVIIVSGFVWIVFYLFLNPFVKTVLEYTLSKATHKHVTIEKVNVKPFDTSVDIENMKIGKVNFTKSYIKLSTYYLLWRKYDIQKAILKANTNVSIAKLITSAESTNSSNTKTSSFKLPKISLPKPKDILKSQQLVTVKRIQKLKKDYEAFKNYLKKQNINKYKKEIERIKFQIQKIQKKASNLNPSDIQALLTQLKQIKKEIKNLKTQINAQKQELLSYKKLLLNDIKSVKEGVKIDTANIKSKYFMLKNGEYIEFTQAVLKPQISKYITLADNVYNKIRPYLPKKHNKKLVIPRRGILIKYPDKIKYPDFVLEKGLISLKTSVAKFEGKIYNLSDNQHLLKKEAVGIIKGNSRFYNFYSQIKYYNDFKINGYAKNIKLKELKLNALILKHPEINADFKGVINKKIDFIIKTYIKNAKIIFKNNSKTSKIIDTVLKEIHSFNVICKIKGEIKKPEIFVSSNLDKVITKSLKKYLQKRYKKELAKINKLLNQKVNSQLKAYNLEEVNLNISELNKEENILNSLKSKVEKEIKKRAKGQILKSIGKFF